MAMFYSAFIISIKNLLLIIILQYFLAFNSLNFNDWILLSILPFLRDIWEVLNLNKLVLGAVRANINFIFNKGLSDKF